MIQATVRHPRVSSSRDHVRGAADRPTYDHAPTVGASCSSRPIPDAPAELGRPPGWLHRLARELDRRGRRVAELLHQVLGYLLDGGIRCRWLVVEGDQDFFWVTKRIHNRLHGSQGDGGPLDAYARDAYLGVLRRELDPILEPVRPGDVAIRRTIRRRRA